MQTPKSLGPSYCKIFSQVTLTSSKRSWWILAFKLWLEATMTKRGHSPDATITISAYRRSNLAMVVKQLLMENIVLRTSRFLQGSISAVGPICCPVFIWFLGSWEWFQRYLVYDNSKKHQLLSETTCPCDFPPDVRLGAVERLGNTYVTTTRYAINYETLLSTDGLVLWFGPVFTSLGVFETSPVSRWLLWGRVRKGANGTTRHADTQRRWVTTNLQDHLSYSLDLEIDYPSK